MSDFKEILLEYACFALAIGLGCGAYFCGKPANIVLAILALVCMFRMVALAFLQELSWKVIVFRLTVTVMIAAELASFYGLNVLRIVLDSLVCVGGLVSFVNLLIYLNKIEDEVDMAE